MIDEQFKDQFGHSPLLTGFTPGRVNLIGEHTDYNGGMVLPTAIELGITIACSPHQDGKIRISSDKFDGLVERDISQPAQDHWSDYITGAIIKANELGFLNGGADILISSTLPFGAGISSSAAVTVGVLKVARDLAKAKTPDKDIAVAAREVENYYIGVPCGIMDQIAVAIAHPGQALALDTRSLKFDLIDLPDDYAMAVIHSGHYRSLSEGRYKIRKEECDTVKAKLGHDDICLASDAEFTALSELDDHLIRRARHCITEHHRTIDAARALKAKDMPEFGRFMNESHCSMRDDFEITVPATDGLVDSAVALGALGARQTGGGFGGCIVACIAKADLKDWTKSLLEKHPKAFYLC